MRIWPYVLAGVAVGGVVALMQRRSFSGGGGQSSAIPPIPGEVILNKPDAIYVGPEDSPETQAQIQTLAEYLKSVGAPLVFPVRDLVYLPKAPKSKKIAIPPQHLWPRMAALLYYVVAPIKAVAPTVYVASGYRPPWYNDNYALGKPQSQHQYFAALDLKEKTYTGALPAKAAEIYTTKGKDLRMGLGIYGSKGTRVHVDVGYKRRTWENADKWLGTS